VLVVLWVLPGGLGGLFYRLRDHGLRWVARRRGLVVPSLLADVRVVEQEAEAAFEARSEEMADEMAEEETADQQAAAGSTGSDSGPDRRHRSGDGSGPPPERGPDVERPATTANSGGGEAS
jgi:hypothetical protein